MFLGIKIQLGELLQAKDQFGNVKHSNRITTYEIKFNVFMN